MKADEKACPYCAETIKAAAIKCRYCQSDLSRPAEAGVAPPPIQATPAAGPGSAAVTDESPAEDPAALGIEVHDDGPAGPAGSASGGIRELLAGRLATLVLAGLALALAIGCVLVWQIGGNDGTAPDGTVVSDDARAVAQSEASDLTEKTLSYSYKDFDALRKKNAARMTAGFAKQYDATMDKVAAKTKKYQVVLDAKVVASGIVSITVHKAEVLVFVNQTTQALAQPSQKPVTDLNRVLVTMVRSDGDWRIEKLNALAGGS